MNVSIYIKEPLLREVKKRAKMKGMSLSSFVERALLNMIKEPIPSIDMKTLDSLEGIVKLGGDALKDTEKYYE
jgi:hypothetical protein